MTRDKAGDSQTTTDEELPFSAEVLGLVQQIEQSSSKEERASLMLQLAESFTAEHDATDESANEDYHGFFDDFVAAQTHYNQAAMRLGRLAVDLVKHYAKSKKSTVEAVAEKANKKAKQPNPSLN